jgi:hypothetical protein
MRNLMLQLTIPAKWIGVSGVEHFYDLRGVLGAFGSGTTLSNALSNPSFVSSAPISRAVSMNRSLWGFSSGFGFLAGME